MWRGSKTSETDVRPLSGRCAGEVGALRDLTLERQTGAGPSSERRYDEGVDGLETSPASADLLFPRRSRRVQDGAENELEVRLLDGEFHYHVAFEVGNAQGAPRNGAVDP